MADLLASRIRERQAEALIEDAKLIRDWGDKAERSSEAANLIREAMHRAAVGRISHEEESRIFSILAFAMPADYNVESEGRQKANPETQS